MEFEKPRVNVLIGRLWVLFHGPRLVISISHFIHASINKATLKAIATAEAAEKALGSWWASSCM